MIIFIPVKFSAHILLLVFGFSFFQPAFCYEVSDGLEMECSSEMECSMPVDGNDPCENPVDEELPEKKSCVIIMCPGCTFTLVENPAFSIVLPTALLKKIFTANDNRVVHTSSDFWNPPKPLLII